MEFLDSYAGKSFNNGLFRVARWADLDTWNELLYEAWPAHHRDAVCFGYTAFGVMLVVTPATRHAGHGAVQLADIDENAVYHTDLDFLVFCNNEIVDDPDAAWAAGNYRAWLASGRPTPQHHQCIGMKTPMFLGGADDLGSNCEIIDMEVHWSVTAPLARATRGMPEGTRIGGIRVE